MKNLLIASMFFFGINALANAGCMKDFGQGPSDIMNIVNSNSFSRCSLGELEFAKIRLGGYIAKKQTEYKSERSKKSKQDLAAQAFITSEITAAKVALMQIERELKGN